MSATAASLIHPRPRRRAGDANLRVAGVMVVSLTVSAGVYLLVDAEIAPLVAPLLANANLALFFVCTLLFHDRQVPVFESGSLWMAATFVYATFPFLGFIAAGMKWTPAMDNRLQQYPFVASEIVWFAWQYTMYIAAFAVTYLLVRRRAAVPLGVFQPLRRSTEGALLFVFVALLAVRWGAYFLYGIDQRASHDTADILQMNENLSRMPLLLRQVVSRMFEGIFLAQLGLAILLLTQWKKHRWARVIPVLWLAYEAAVVYVRESARSPLILLVLCMVLFYHRLVRPLSFKVVMLGSAAFLTGFLTLGILRMHLFAPDGIGFRSALTITNEFQALFTNAFDLYQRQRLGTLGPVPWQIYAVDLYLEIPRQLLPFEKIDPAIWYLGVLGIHDLSIGFAFGVMAQAVLGFGWIELIARGAALGLFYGALHRWYVKRAARLWPTLFYVFVSIWSFYSFRATTFWFVHFVVYQFVPFFAVVKLTEAALERKRATAS